jgi:hypothetical protein
MARAARDSDREQRELPPSQGNLATPGGGLLTFGAKRSGYVPCPLRAATRKIRRRRPAAPGLAPPILSPVGIGFSWPLRLVIPVWRRNWRHLGRIAGVIGLVPIAGRPGPIVIQV